MNKIISAKFDCGSGSPALKIAVLGGGNAVPKAVLQGLKNEPVEISAVCAMLDTGGSSGRLRRDYGILSPGDIRRAFVALANTSPVLEELFNYRFEAGELSGHNFANLFITALELSTNNTEKTIEEMNRILNVSHRVFPATLDDAELCAELEDGSIIRGETNIDIPKHNGKIKRVFLDPQAKGYSPAIQAVKEADLIIIGPGDVYSSLAQIILTQNMAEAIRNRKGKLVYICNIMNKNGETNDFTVPDFAKTIEGFIGGKLDYVIYNTTNPLSERLNDYKEKHKELIDMVSCPSLDSRFIGEDLLKDEGPVVHDTNKLCKLILNL